MAFSTSGIFFTKYAPEMLTRNTVLVVSNRFDKMAKSLAFMSFEIAKSPIKTQILMLVLSGSMKVCLLLISSETISTALQMQLTQIYQKSTIYSVELTTEPIVSLTFNEPSTIWLGDITSNSLRTFHENQKQFVNNSRKTINLPHFRQFSFKWILFGGKVSSKTVLKLCDCWIENYSQAMKVEIELWSKLFCNQVIWLFSHPSFQFTFFFHHLTQRNGKI